MLPGGDELQEEASGGVDELGMHVTELLEYEGGEADEDGQTPRGIVGHQVAECVRGEQLELVVDVYGEACEDVDELRVAEGRHEARHQRHACAQQAQARLVVAARVQLLAQLGQHAVHAAAATATDVEIVFDEDMVSSRTSSTPAHVNGESEIKNGDHSVIHVFWLF